MVLLTMITIQLKDPVFHVQKNKHSENPKPLVCDINFYIYVFAIHYLDKVLFSAISGLSQVGNSTKSVDDF